VKLSFRDMYRESAREREREREREGERESERERAWVSCVCHRERRNIYIYISSYMHIHSMRYTDINIYMYVDTHIEHTRTHALTHTYIP
jgi:hypothetical protein